ncbi:MAG TPA: OmpA family protein [Pirellulales bacterium]|nr:OmpA family protein [Pirellulales bacterium]
MRVAAVARSLCLGLLALAGCADNPYVLQSKNQNLEKQQAALEQRNQELQARASTLDHDNQELEALLAQSRQQNRLLDDQLAAVRSQLSGTTQQLAQVRDQKNLTDKQVEAMVASTKRRTGATITANSSLDRALPAIHIPGVDVRADGDVVRVEMSAAQLFQPGGVAMQPTAGATLDTVATELARSYPDQIIGVEGHTEGEGGAGSGWATNQQLSVSRALAVYQYLGTRGPLKPQALFTVGHGGNHPIVSNATPDGRSRNNRIELVVYPDKYTQQ